jgi:dienelactone hydrolase
MNSFNFFSKMIIFFLLIFNSLMASAYDYQAINSPNNDVFLINQRTIYTGNVRNKYEGKLSTSPRPTSHDLTVPFYFYRSQLAGPRPVLVIPPSLEGVTLLEHNACRFLASAGINCFIYIPQMVLQDYQRKLEDIDGLFKYALRSLKLIIDWTEKNPGEFDQNKIGVMGISLGGILSAMILGQDSRVKAGYLVVAGGDLPSLFTYGENKYLTGYRNLNMQKENIRTYSTYEQKLRNLISVDPLKLNIYRSSQDIFMVMAGKDKVVPFRNQELLWNALGRPPRYIYPNLGHTTTALTVPLVMRKILYHLTTAWSFYQERN